MSKKSRNFALKLETRRIKKPTDCVVAQRQEGRFSTMVLTHPQTSPRLWQEHHRNFMYCINFYGHMKWDTLRVCPNKTI